MDWKLELVILPVTDVDRAIAFYRGLGFSLDADHVMSDELRFVQLTPPGSACSIAVGTGLTAAEPGSVKGLQAVVADVDAAHATLVAAGVEVAPVEDLPWGSFAYFADPDGNAWALQQLTPRA